MTMVLLASSCNKDSLLPEARRAVLPSGDTIAIDCGDDIPTSALPDVVRDAIAAEFPGWYIDEVERCDGGMGLIFYLVELDRDDDAYRYVLYTEDGIRLLMFSDDDDDDDWDDDDYDDDDELFISAAGDTIRVDCDYDIASSALPGAVLSAVAALYPDYEIEDAERCDAAGPGMFFLLELERESDDDDIYAGFDADGSEYTYVDYD